eukprot:scaffold58957_cov67-Phaeocystis_antarctica.AAC.1
MVIDLVHVVLLDDETQAGEGLGGAVHVCRASRRNCRGRRQRRAAERLEVRRERVLELHTTWLRIQHRRPDAFGIGRGLAKRR